MTLMLCLQLSQKGSNLAPALTALNLKEVLPFLRLAAESKPWMVWILLLNTLLAVQREQVAWNTSKG